MRVYPVLAAIPSLLPTPQTHAQARHLTPQDLVREAQVVEEKPYANLEQFTCLDINREKAHTPKKPGTGRYTLYENTWLSGLLFMRVLEVDRKPLPADKEVLFLTEILEGEHTYSRFRRFHGSSHILDGTQPIAKPTPDKDTTP